MRMPALETSGSYGALYSCCQSSRTLDGSLYGNFLAFSLAGLAVKLVHGEYHIRVGCAHGNHPAYVRPRLHDEFLLVRRTGGYLLAAAHQRCKG